MSADDVRKGIAQSKTTQQGATVLAIDAAICGVLAWKYTGLWALGIVGFIFAVIMLFSLASNPQLSARASLAGGLSWAAVACYICVSTDMSIGNILVVTVIAGAVSAGWHMLGFQHMSDIK